MKPRETPTQEATPVVKRGRLEPSYDNRPLTEADWPRMREEAHRIAKSRGLGVFQAKAEWLKFKPKFEALGETKLRWDNEWDIHCANVKRGVTAPPPRSFHEVDEL